jgi:exosome complex component RRP45
MLDCACLAGIVALKHFRRPDVEVVGDDVIVVRPFHLLYSKPLILTLTRSCSLQHAPTERAPVPLAIHHTPFCLTFAFFPPSPSTATSNLDSNALPVFDPTHLEQRLSTGTLSVALNAQREICVLHKAGGLPLAAEEVMRVVDVAVAKAGELDKWVESRLKEDWEGRHVEVR